jgi:hypothetical protein
VLRIAGTTKSKPTDAANAIPTTVAPVVTNTLLVFDMFVETLGKK